MRSLLLVVLLLSLVLPCAAAETTEKPYTGVKIYLTDPGVYRISYDDLLAAGLDLAGTPVDRLSISNAGEPVPIWIKHGGDGLFGPGDWIEMVGRRLPGEVSYHNEFSPINVYLLHWDGAVRERMHPPDRSPSQETLACQPEYLVHEHLEEDQLLLRFAGQQQNEELWFWQRLSHIDQQPFTFSLPLSGINRNSSRTVTLRVQLRGWSNPARRTNPDMPDHHLDILLGSEVVGSVEWNRQTVALAEVELPIATLLGNDGELSLSVPKRQPSEDSDPLIDVVLLNWIEVSYPRHIGVGTEQGMMQLEHGCGADPVRIYTSADRQLVVYSEDGTRIAGKHMLRRKARTGGYNHLFYLPEGSLFWTVPDGALYTPLAMEPDRSTNLRQESNQADYLIITHPSLSAAVEPLAELHRERGLAVKIIDITDVYDEFNHGILHPRAIKDLISYAYHSWARPAPRFVLLVGDASWDTKNQEARNRNYVSWTYSSARAALFPASLGTPYEQNPKLNNRNLIPTWSHLTREGHAASDNYFVRVDGDDELPDLAIGRLPVVDPDEVAAIVDKTIRYSSNRPVGPWRRQILWISDGESYMDRMSDRLATSFAEAGYAAHKVKPLISDPDNEHHRQRLRDGFDEGQALVHFVGHGGRFIWRTAPADFEKNRDLFTLDDIDQLQPSSRLPIVVSMTCYSAPFDHPSSDSIGEKFLRSKDKGAIAVIAASWRISPSLGLSQMLLEELTRPGTVGEAVMRTKQQGNHHDFLHIFNLLGDPALPLEPPSAEIGLHMDGAATLEITLPRDEIRGNAIAELIDASGTVLAEERLVVDRPQLRVGFTLTSEQRETATHARAYVWSEETGEDWLGSLPLSGQDDDGGEPEQ